MSSASYSVPFHLILNLEEMLRCFVVLHSDNKDNNLKLKHSQSFNPKSSMLE